MSEVDLKVFKELIKASGKSQDLADLVFSLCEGYFRDVLYIKYEGPDQYANTLQTLKEEWDYEHLDQEGGGEGGEEYCYGVFRLKGVVYKAEYSYYSHQGHNYDGIIDTLKIVKPIEKTIIVWE